MEPICPAVLIDFVRDLGHRPETCQQVGPVWALAFKKIEEGRRALTDLQVFGFRVAQTGAVLIISGRESGNVFADQRMFQHIFQQHLLPHPEANYALYRKLIEEELGELDAATSAEEHLDALIDLIYVTIGAGIALGHDMSGAWAEVHRTNMAKLGADGKPIIREDGKVVKPQGWTPPALQQFVGHILPQFQLAQEIPA